MSFLFDKTVQAGIPGDITGLRGDLASQLQRGLGLWGAPDQFMIEQIIRPYREQFAQTRKQGLASAKESAGTLTGSGLGNILGGYMQRSMLDENALIGQLLSDERNRILSAALGLGTAGVSGQPYTQQGFLSSLFGAGAAAAPFIAMMLNRQPTTAYPGSTGKQSAYDWKATVKR